jgi:hypothetical protein
MDEARTFPTDADDTTPVFLSTDFGLDRIILREGLSALDLGDFAKKQENPSHAQKYYKDAAEKFGKIEQIPSGIVVPKRIKVEFETNWALVHANAGNMEEFMKHFLAGLQGAKELGSNKRKQEAMDSLMVAIHRWSHETRVTDLLSLLR